MPAPLIASKPLIYKEFFEKEKDPDGSFSASTAEYCQWRQSMIAAVSISAG
ncbi:hypothetical protein [Stutzerimonas nitrititolerans]|uniref:hypothetical protein n=1 Tax=Stutzerimonas nitrititolerans TaxID=2482751 RepID=UPI00137A7163|nr:hypothetical protein [Stutzerimonas nitrititolerans]